MKQQNEISEGQVKSLYKIWKEAENRRKLQFAAVMQERRRLKMDQSLLGSPKNADSEIKR